MRIGLYSPYLAEHTGGGERYLLSVAKCLQQDHVVDVVIDRPHFQIAAIRDRLEGALHLPLNKVRFVSGPFGRRDSFAARYFFTRQYDVFYYLTDGSFFVSGARYNLVHIQIPLPNPLKGPVACLKFLSWKVRIANSKFTKQHIERLWCVAVQHVHRVPCQTDAFRPKKKEKLILSVGRFFTGLHNKKHEILIEAFKRLLPLEKDSTWRLVLAGSLSPGEENSEYLSQLRESARGFPIAFAVDAHFGELADLYGRSMFYWHAAGFGEDEQEHPERFEHFGITTVEAMAAGCVPIVFNGGGQREIIRNGQDGYLWETVDELVTITRRVIQNQSLRETFAKRARERSVEFGEKTGCEQFRRILAEVTT